MKIRKYINLFVGIMVGILCSGITVFATYSYLSSDISFIPSNSNWNVTNVEDALNYLYNSTGENCPTDLIGTVWDYTYTGDSQSFIAPCKGIYKIEAWGAQGGTAADSLYIGGYGGYSTGLTNFNQYDKVYVIVGGSGTNGVSTTLSGGYNGGGTGQSVSPNANFASGGGATHISFKSGLLSTLSENQSSILLVAGGGGGSWYQNSGKYTILQHGGSGGGYIGGSANGTISTSDNSFATGGTQISGGTLGSFNSIATDVSGTFGQGGHRTGDCGSGGGGGYFGGAGTNCTAGAGGSSYIANENLISNDVFQKHMTCYNCTTSTDESTYTIVTTNVSSTPTSDYVKSGNGYARITLISN